MDFMETEWSMDYERNWRNVVIKNVQCAITGFETISDIEQWNIFPIETLLNSFVSHMRCCLTACTHYTLCVYIKYPSDHRYMYRVEP